MPKISHIRIVLCLAVLSILVSAAKADRIDLKDPIRLPDNQLMKAVYMYPHWWEPWKSDDNALSADLKKASSLGINTVCLDHEVSQAVDKEWYWLDREYKLVGQEKMYILPWLQLQGMDRLGLMKFSHLTLRPAMDQDKQIQDDSVNFMDDQFRQAMAHYISVYLDRYGADPALLKIKDGKTIRPVVALISEAGWRTPNGLPLSFDDETNTYFRKWMRATYHDLNDLNTKWGTNYKSFDEIDPCNKAIFNYATADKQNMPLPVREHVHFRARLINSAMEDIARRVRKRHKDVVFVAEIAYPFNSDDPKAADYRWNNANEYRAVDFADILFVRTLGNTCSAQDKKDQDLMIFSGKRIIMAYRLFQDSFPTRAAAFALDCAMCANGIAYYNWNETADSSSAVYNNEEKQAMLKLMNGTYDLLYDSNNRHELAKPTAAETAPAAPAEVAPAPVTVAPAEGTPAQAAPAQPTPAQAAPAQTAPAQAAPAQAAPAQAAPAQAAPAQAAPAKAAPAPAAPAKAAPAKAAPADDSEESDDPVIAPVAPQPAPAH